MSRNQCLGAAAVAALLVAPVLALAAQQDPAPADASTSSGMNSGMTTAPSATASGVDTTAVTMPANQMPQGQASALASGDNKLVTNGPVPDTPANRAKYGKPMSHGGQHTDPAGN